MLAVNSLKTRLLVTSVVVLALFVAFTGLALERAVYQRSLQAEEDRLQGLVYGVLGAMDVDGDAAVVNLEELPEPRLSQPDSGLYAALIDAQGREQWRSPSMLEDLPGLFAPAPPAAGEWRFHYQRLPRSTLALEFSVRWLGESPAQAADYRVVVVRDGSQFERQRESFQRTLWLWLIVSAALLMALQYAVLRWGLAPLTRVESQVREIESGSRERVTGSYPSELDGMVDGLNGLIAHAARQQTRYRNALDDLAHSLKTPLAALRASLTGGGFDRGARERADEQIARMDDIVRYQLGKAAAVGVRTWQRPVSVLPLIEKVTAVLRKVHHDETIEFTVRSNDVSVTADPDDLLELLGNLLENAARHCRSRVAVETEAVNDAFSLVVDDDGPGFPDDPERLLQRGVRADVRTAGQGLGLAMVAEMVSSYRGEIALQRSPLGGARVSILLPDIARYG